MARGVARNVQNGRKLQGVDTVMRNLNKNLNKIGMKSMRGLIRAAILIRRDMDKTPPLVPVDYGNLRASIFVVSGLGGTTQDGGFVGPNSSQMSGDHTTMVAREGSKVAGKKIVAIGVSASYARHVEEDTVTRRERPGSGGGFFENAILRNKANIIRIIKKDAKLRK